MQPPTQTLLLPLLLLLTPLTTAAKPKPKDAILLSQVKSLTFSSHRQTTHRRVPSIPQLKCISPAPICALHPLPTLHCLNTGASYSPEDITWSCTAPHLPTTLRLGSTDVICEGYDSPDDPYVLRGSCGVEYRLVLSEEGERVFPELAGAGSTKSGEGRDWSAYLFALLFVGVAGWMVYGACVDGRGGGGQGARAGRRRPGGGGGGPGGWGGGGWGPGGGGGGDDAWDDPPPPYPGTKRSSTTAAGNAGGWGPGFWSGLAGGAAAGYAAGNLRNRPEQDNRRGRWGGGGSSWASGSGTQGGSSSSSGATHESTGFGSTSRR